MQLAPKRNAFLHTLKKQIDKFSPA